MTSKIFLSFDQKIYKAALKEDGHLAEFYLESSPTSAVGNIYMGKITDVLKGMQAAFCNIGGTKNAYLSTSEILADTTGETPRFALSVGQELLVQVVKDGRGGKGARVSPNLSIAGRLLVMTPMMDFVGVSRRITDEKARTRLSKIIDAARPSGVGFIARTLCENAQKKDIEHELNALCATYDQILRAAGSAKAGELVYRENNLIERILRDTVTSDTKEIYADSGAYPCAESYLKRFLPAFLNCLILEDKRDLFAKYKLSEEADGLIDRRCNLKCGGYLVFDKTEALTVVDVNSGKYVGDVNLEETVVKVNLEACAEIVRQLRLRNISGIIVVDFIDMKEEASRESVLAELRRCALSDRVRVNVVGMSELGLVEMTRRRTRPEYAEGVSAECPYCGGGKFVYSSEYLASKIRASLIDIFIDCNPRAVTVYVSDRVFDELCESRFLADKIEREWLDKRIYLAPDLRLHVSEYRIQQMPNGIVLDLPDSARLLY